MSPHFLGKCCATANAHRLHFGVSFLEEHCIGPKWRPQCHAALLSAYYGKVMGMSGSI